MKASTRWNSERKVREIVLWADPEESPSQYEFERDIISQLVGGSVQPGDIHNGLAIRPLGEPGRLADRNPFVSSNVELLLKPQGATQDRVPILGHFHCETCRSAMNPVKRLPWTSKHGVRHIHYCMRCGAVQIESEREG